VTLHTLCTDHRLSLVHVSPNVLGKDLLTLESKLQHHYGLAIPRSQILENYHLRTTSCHMTPNGTIIVIQVPLIYTDNNYELYSLETLPFHFNGSTCHIKTEPLLLAVGSST